MVNAKHDTPSYENCSYKREIFDGNNLYEGFKKAKKNSDWKSQVQKFEMYFLTEIAKLHREIKEKTYKLSPTNEFILNERGKTRQISGDHIRDRVSKRVLCDEALLPAIRKYLIYDNGASLEGKGISFTRNRLDVHLRRYYLENGSNEGYILLSDYSKYFDNIRHEILLNMFKEVIKDDNSIRLLEMILEKARIDVSYMDDCEFAKCLNIVFNSLEHQAIDESLLTGEKYMAKHLNIGDQVSQVAGIFYPTKVDNFIKIVKGMKFYNRYMDDSYIVHKDKSYLSELLEEITEVANSIGITIHPNKTRICKLSDYWRFLQIQYSLTDTGRIIKKIHPKRLTDMRRKLKKLAPVLTEREFGDLYKPWFRNHYKIMSKKQRENMDILVKELKERYYDA